MFLGGCPCCGKKECWRCYEFDNTCEAITETCRTICSSDGVARELWKSAFSIKSATVDTDTATPVLLTGQILSFDDGNPGGTSTHRFYNGADIFGLPTTYSVFTQDPIGTQGIGSLAVLCQPDGSFVFRINVICETAFNSIVSAKKDGTELPNRTDPAYNRAEWTWNSDTVDPLFSSAGTFEFLFADGTSLSISIQDLISGGIYHQCFDAPPTEDGWTPVGKCHATEEECAEACGPWRCYGKFNLPNDCGELPNPCICDGKEYSIPDTFTGVLTYDSIEYNPDSSLAESEVDFSQLQILLDSGKSGMTFSRSSLVPPSNDFPNKWIFSNNPDGSLVPERCGDFGGNVASSSSLDFGGCAGEAVPLFSGAGFSAPGAGQADYYTSILPNSNGFGYCDWGVFDNTGKIEYSICDSEVLTITISGSSRAQITDCLYRFGTTLSFIAVYSLVNAKFTFTIPLIIDSQSGACCLPTGECSVTTHQECADQCGIWTPDATCEDTPCEPVRSRIVPML